MCGKDGKVSRGDYIYSMFTDSNPKQYSPLMSDTAIYIAFKPI
jgi:hypothetical protein